MRDSKFRGKRLDNGEWICGDLLQLGGNRRTFIFTDEDYISQFAEKAHRLQREVDPSTVGQYTGLRDKNGKEIWEGDIFKDDRGVARSVFRVPGGLAFEDDPVSFGYDHRSPAYPYTPIADPQVVSWLAQCCEIIGNIHDDPKLLEQ
jgi:uncharacterized phage protein (TIGR01671 family)